MAWTRGHGSIEIAVRGAGSVHKDRKWGKKVSGRGRKLVKKDQSL